MATNNTRQAAWIGLGSMFSFGFAIVSSMILSRYFDKGDYGTYKQVMYVYNTLLTVFTLGLPKAFSYFLPRVEITEAKSLIRKITNLFFLLGAIFSALLFLFSPTIALFLNNPDLDEAIKIFAIVPFLMLPTMGLEGVLATYKKTIFMALYTIVTRTAMLLCVAIPVMIFGYGYKTALLGFVVASFISFVLALYLQYYPIRNVKSIKCNVSYNDIFKFSLPLLYASLWGTIIASSDQFFISRYFGNEVFAEFSNGFIELPFVGMIISSCATVLSPVYSKLSNESINPMKDIYPLWMSVVKKTALLIYPIIIYCIIFSDVIMLVLYGTQYEGSAIYFRIKLLSNYFTIIMFAPLVINIGKVKEYANIHMFTAFILILLEYLSINFVNTPYAIAVISVLCSIGKLLALAKICSGYFKIHVKNLFPFKLFIRILFSSLTILLLERYVIFSFFDFNSILKLIISIILYILLFLPCAHLFKMDYWVILKPFFKK